MNIWLKNPLDILCEGGKGGVVIKDDKIHEILDLGKMPSIYIDFTLDASRYVILPGLINIHHHFYQTLTRALPCSFGKSLFPWLEALYPVWANVDGEMLFDATVVACAELVQSGCTTIFDHHYIYPLGLENAVDIIFAAASSIGIRMIVGRGSMSMDVAQGGLPPSSLVQSEEDILLDCERVINKYHQKGDGAMQQIVLAPCSPFSVSKNLMFQTAQLARKYGVKLHTHLSETIAENKFCVSHYGCRPLQYLEESDWLGSDLWLAHGIHFNHEEISLLGKTGIGIAHCPTSNMVLSSGICPVLELTEAGCPVGLGVDGSASNDSSNIMQEARQAFLLQRLFGEPERISAYDPLKWATAGSAKCLGRDDIGHIKIGKKADLALFSLDDLRYSSAGDPLAALTLCGANKADYVLINGEFIVYNGEINNIDVELIKYRHKISANRLWSKSSLVN